MLRIVFLNGFLFICVLAYSQPYQYRFHNYGQSEGLASSTVNALAEDEFGFIWVGTEDGLYRYDSYNFKVFRRTRKHDNGLSNNSITALMPETNGDLWVGTHDGLHYFNSRTEKFTNLWAEEEPTYISKIISDRKGKLWIGTKKGLLHYDPNTKTYKKYIPNAQDSTSISGDRIFDIMYDSKGRLWVSTSDGGLNYYEPSTQSFQSFKYNSSDPNSISSDVLRNIAETPDGKILIGSYDDGLNVLDPETFQFTHYNHQPDNPFSLSARSVYSLLVDNQENIWVGTWSNGLNLFDPKTGKSRRFIYNPDDLYSIPHMSIQCLMQSSTGDIWIGTDDGGLSRLSLEEQQIVRYQHNTNDKNSLLTSYIRSVYEDPEGILWIGTGQHGLHRYDPISEKFKVYLKSDRSRDAKARGTIWSISPGKDNILWLGTSRGVGKFDMKSGKVKFYEPDDKDPNAISTNNIMKVLDDQKGNLWITTWAGGMNRMDIENEIFEHFTHDENDPNSLSSNNIGDVYIDQNDRLWVSNGIHLHLLNPDNKTFIRFDIPTYMIAEDQRGDLWLATNIGLVKFDTKEMLQSETFGEIDGLSSEYLRTISIDSEGKIWVGSANGIDRYDPKNETITHIDKGDGLVANNIGIRASYYSQKSGKLFFAGIQGLSEIDPKILRNTDYVPPVLLTNLRLFNKTVEVGDTTALSQSLHTAENITLNYKDYIFAIEFAALSYHQPEKVRYQYKLEGFDSEWITTNHTDRKAVYTNVPHGDYVFKVRASNHQGIWQEGNVASIGISIVPPWWKTWWAKSLFYFSILAGGILIFQLRISIIKKQKSLLEEKVRKRSSEVLRQKEELEIQAVQLKEVNKQKNKLFSIIGHDLRAPLNTLSGILHLLDPKILSSAELTILKEDLGVKIQSVSSVMDNLLRWAKGQMEGEVIHQENFPLDQIIKEKIELFTPNAALKNIKLVNHISSGHTVLADINHVRVILRNIISNAIKFTNDGGTIEINATQNSLEVTISVTDSGVGMTTNQLNKLYEIQTKLSTQGTAGERGVGLGLLLVKEFVEKNNGRIWVESTEGIGTTFYFTLKNGNSTKLET